MTSTTALVREIKRAKPKSLEVEPVSPEVILESGWSGDRRVPDHWFLALDLVIQGKSIAEAAAAAKMTSRQLLAIMDNQVDMHALVQRRTDGVRRRAYLFALLELVRRLEDPAVAKFLKTRDLVDAIRATRTLEAGDGKVQRQVNIDSIGWGD